MYRTDLELIEEVVRGFIIHDIEEFGAVPINGLSVQLDGSPSHKEGPG